MKHRMLRWTSLVVTILCMLLLIFHAKTAVDGAQKGIEISLHAVIPSLFPFIVLSCLICNHLSGRRIPFLCHISRLCGVPDGAESLLLLGLLGGYPVGAQVIAEVYRSKQLDRDNALRMLGFCNNAGPAFLFGMIGPMFSKNSTVFVLWGVHILSALLTGLLLPGRKHSNGHVNAAKPISLPEALEKSVRIVAVICGWVILFRIILTLCNQWILGFLPPVIRVLLTGLCELSNGCMELMVIEAEHGRFIVSSFMLAAGGLCVGMQTASVTKELGMGAYFLGKTIQSTISVLISVCLAPLLFPGECTQFNTPVVLCSAALTLGMIVFFAFFRKKSGILHIDGV